jgi:hypothetical protein
MRGGRAASASAGGDGQRVCGHAFATVEDHRGAVRDMIGRPVHPDTFTDDARTVMVYSQAHARWLGRTRQGGEHLLLILAAADVPVAAVLREHRVTAERVPGRRHPARRAHSTGPRPSRMAPVCSL